MQVYWLDTIITRLNLKCPFAYPLHRNGFISKSSGAIDAGQSESVEIRLKAGMILTGNYESILNLTSNDPKNLKSEVPVALTVKASKLLATNPTQLNFGDIEVGLSKNIGVYHFKQRKCPG